MKHHRLDDMTKGWFVGDFSPVVVNSKKCEVAIKRYSAGDYEAPHYHRIATEVTTVISGRIKMLGREWNVGDILTIEPGEATDFMALSDAITVVVKVPSIVDDKYFVESE